MMTPDLHAFFKAPLHFSFAAVLLPACLSPSLTQAAAADVVGASRAGDERLVAHAIDCVEKAGHALQYLNTEGAAAALPTGEGPRLSIAVSMSLEAGYRKELRVAAEKAGMRLVLRGLPVSPDHARKPYWGAKPAARALLKSEITAGAARVHEVFGSADIDPAFFRKHTINAAPAFVLEDGVGHALIVRGAVTSLYALETLYTALKEKKTIEASVRRAMASEIVRLACQLKKGGFGDEAFMGVPCDA